MAKGKRKTKTVKSTVVGNAKALKNAETEMKESYVEVQRMLMNAITTSRSGQFSRFLNRGIDINYECRYPDDISKGEYAEMYSREGLAKRVVNIFPEESWLLFPVVKEDEKSTDKTEFDEAWESLVKEKHVYHYLLSGDNLSGVGRYGILLLGIDDGETLDKPVVGVDEKTGEVKEGLKYELLYLRVFQENTIEIDQTETDPTNARFGQPILYSINFEDSTGNETVNTKIHWTRVIHLADNRESSEIFGEPRMKPVYNRLLDVRKVLSGSGEMFWKGGFPGLGFQTTKENSDATIDGVALKTQVEKYQSGLQRYLALQGLEVKTLEPNIADPHSHLEVQVDYISISIGVPKRIFMGSERGELASNQDTNAWVGRIMKRREDYNEPMILRPFIDRLIDYGILPEVEEYVVIWPDLHNLSEKERAGIAEKRTNALAKYVSGDVEAIMGPKEFLMHVLGFTKDEVEAIEKGALGLDSKDGDDDQNVSRTKKKVANKKKKKKKRKGKK